MDVVHDLLRPTPVVEMSHAYHTKLGHRMRSAAAAYVLDNLEVNVAFVAADGSNHRAAGLSFAALHPRE
jgi:hypothetical protein